MNVETISALVLGATGLLTALCVGLRQLHIRKIKSKCMEIEMATMSSSDEEIKNNIV